MVCESYLPDLNQKVYYKILKSVLTNQLFQNYWQFKMKENHENLGFRGKFSNIALFVV